MGDGSTSTDRPSPSLRADWFASEPITPALDATPGRGREVRRATQGTGVAIALQELAPRNGGLCRVDVEYDRQFRVSRLQWRVHEVAADDAVGAIATEIDRRMAGRVSGCRQYPHEIVDLVVVAHHVAAFGL